MPESHFARILKQTQDRVGNMLGKWIRKQFNVALLLPGWRVNSVSTCLSFIHWQKFGLHFTRRYLVLSTVSNREFLRNLMEQLSWLFFQCLENKYEKPRELCQLKFELVWSNRKYGESRMETISIYFHKYLEGKHN